MVPGLQSPPGGYLRGIPRVLAPWAAGHQRYLWGCQGLGVLQPVALALMTGSPIRKPPDPQLATSAPPPAVGYSDFCLPAAWHLLKDSSGPSGQ